MKKDHLAYWLINDGNLFEDRPELITATRTEINPQFDQKQLVFGRNRIGANWPENVSVFVAGSEPVDLLLCSPYMQVVSEHARQVIQDVAEEDVEFLPVKVFHENGDPYTRMTYWARNILTILDALDWEHTIWIDSTPPSTKDPMAVLNLIKPCFYAHKIVDKHFFRVEVGGAILASEYVSRTLKIKLQKEKCTVGMDFGPVKTT